MHIYLKVKIASLADEARIIRRYERRALKSLRRTRNWPEALPWDKQKTFFGLRQHRIWDVRREARSSCLAYGFLRGHTYRQLEAKCYTAPDWKRIEKLIERYGEGDKRDLAQRFSEWKSEA